MSGALRRRAGWRAWLRRVGAILAVSATLLVLSPLAPVQGWRTGEQPVAPLPLTTGGPPVSLAHRVWVDTDAACGAGGRADSDDCLALLALLKAPHFKVVGVSSVAGNADAETTHRTVASLFARLPASPPLYRGGSGADGRPDSGEGASAPAAVAALRRALAAGPLTIVALGPLTNVAAALERRPDLQAQVARLVAVMGRRRGHLFHPSEGHGHGILLGHGPIFTDFNVRQDPAAAAAVLAMGLPTTLVPYDVARSIRIDAADLDRLAAAGGAAAWVAAGSRDWLKFWIDVVGLPGFYPFDLLAAAYVLEPQRFHCAWTAAWVTRAPDLYGWLYSPVSVLVGLPRERPRRVRVATHVVYCPVVDPAIHETLVERLAGVDDGLNARRDPP